MLAFLDMIAFAEGTSTSPATKCKGYDVIVTGEDRKPEVFTDFSQHPFAGGRKSKVIREGLTSNAAGRYQFMGRYWLHYKAALSLPDFGPASQDKWAIQLIRECRAIDLVESGNIVAAIVACKSRWASLPGAGYNQKEHKAADLLAAYTRAGGVLT
ncbi:MAG: glycoside hydrolase family 104 protein [Pseudomonadota bacterium]